MKKSITLEQDDINHLHDVILEAYNEDFSDEKVIETWKDLPEYIQNEGIHWGLIDTVVSDKIYVYLTRSRI